MSIYQPVELEVFVVVSEGVDQLLGDLQQPHVEEELEHREDRDVEINVQGDPAAAHGLVHVESVDLLSADDGEDEEDVGRQGDHLAAHI